MTWVRDVWTAQYRSYRSLPAWVQVWVAWLVGVNVVVGMDGSTPTGRAVAKANLAFLPANAGLVIRQRGYSSALSFSHLLAWPPLIIRLLARADEVDCDADERRRALLVAATNSVSVGFDVLDAARWLRGDRSVAGA